MKVRSNMYKFSYFLEDKLYLDCYISEYYQLKFFIQVMREWPTFSIIQVTYESKE